jgi:pyruvate kinase
LLSALRPKAPIYAATDSTSVAERLALQWGVVPIVCGVGSEEDVERSIVTCGAVDAGAVVVFVNVSPDLTHPHANFLTLRRLP